MFSNRKTVEVHDKCNVNYDGYGSKRLGLEAVVATFKRKMYD